MAKTNRRLVLGGLAALALVVALGSAWGDWWQSESGASEASFTSDDPRDSETASDRAENEGRLLGADPAGKTDKDKEKDGPNPISSETLIKEYIRALAAGRSDFAAALGEQIAARKDAADALLAWYLHETNPEDLELPYDASVFLKARLVLQEAFGIEALIPIAFEELQRRWPDGDRKNLLRNSLFEEQIANQHFLAAPYHGLTPADDLVVGLAVDVAGVSTAQSTILCRYIAGVIADAETLSAPQPYEAWLSDLIRLVAEQDAGQLLLPALDALLDAKHSQRFREQVERKIAPKLTNLEIVERLNNMSATRASDFIVQQLSGEENAAERLLTISEFMYDRYGDDIITVLPGVALQAASGAGHERVEAMIEVAGSAISQFDKTNPLALTWAGIGATLYDAVRRRPAYQGAQLKVPSERLIELAEERSEDAVLGGMQLVWLTRLSFETGAAFDEAVRTAGNVLAHATSEQLDFIQWECEPITYSLRRHHQAEMAFIQKDEAAQLAEFLRTLTGVEPPKTRGKENTNWRGLFATLKVAEYIYDFGSHAKKHEMEIEQLIEWRVRLVQENLGELEKQAPPSVFKQMNERLKRVAE